MELLFYAWYPYSFYFVRVLYVHHIHFTRSMIASDTSYKQMEIIRDTWPNIYRPSKVSYTKEKKSKDEKVQQ